uniref:Uncharacterized protein n=1 Tax=Arundo donax TaxID=35708 RepID=A0A0A8XYJ1_ARUDO
MLAFAWYISQLHNFYHISYHCNCISAISYWPLAKDEKLGWWG